MFRTKNTFSAYVPGNEGVPRSWNSRRDKSWHRHLQQLVDPKIYPGAANKTFKYVLPHVSEALKTSEEDGSRRVPTGPDGSRRVPFLHIATNALRSGCSTGLLCNEQLGFGVLASATPAMASMYHSVHLQTGWLFVLQPRTGDNFEKPLIVRPEHGYIDRFLPGVGSPDLQRSQEGMHSLLGSESSVEPWLPLVSAFLVYGTWAIRNDKFAW